MSINAGALTRLQPSNDLGTIAVFPSVPTTLMISSQMCIRDSVNTVRAMVMDKDQIMSFLAAMKDSKAEKPLSLIHIWLTTSSTAVFVPFTTQELFQSGDALYYGLNALSNNMIMVDRKQLKNPNGLILGKMCIRDSPSAG